MAAPSSPKVAPIYRLSKAMTGHSRTVRLAALCSVLNKLWDLAPPLLIGVAVDVKLGVGLTIITMILIIIVKKLSDFYEAKGKKMFLNAVTLLVPKH